MNIQKNKKALPKVNSNSKTNKANNQTIRSKGDVVVKLENITKTFLNGKIVANSNVNLEVKYNEIHALCGENGAGKSTLMSILFGLYKPDIGKVFVNGVETHFKNAKEATQAGIGMVHQHFKLVQIYSLLDNIVLGAEKTNFGFLDKKKMLAEVQKICTKYNFDIDLLQKTKDASVGQQQRTEIVKLLYRGADILIFDEPTAVLSDREIKSFLEVIKILKKQGKTIIIITHKLNEVKQVADRLTVLRKGETVGTYNIDDLNEQQIVEKMVGRVIEQIDDSLNLEDLTTNVLEIKDLCACKASDRHQKALHDVNLTIRPGEIYGIAGIEGNGQTELALAITGLLKTTSGSIKVKNNNVWYDISNMSPKFISNLGVGHVPEDRHKYGLILDETVGFNLISNQLDSKQYCKLKMLNVKEMNLNAVNICSYFDIRGANRGKAVARSLSGGNQQKIVVAREMLKEHNLIVMVQPTRGLDIGAINFIHQKMIQDAEKGAAVLLISYELDEILKICSRISVMDNGKIVFTDYKKNVSRAKIGEYLTRAKKIGGK